MNELAEKNNHLHFVQINKYGKTEKDHFMGKERNG